MSGFWMNQKILHKTTIKKISFHSALINECSINESMKDETFRIPTGIQLERLVNVAATDVEISGLRKDTFGEIFTYCSMTF